MICEQKPSKVRCLKVFFIFAFFYALTLALHAEELSKPLWTPEHVVTQPEVTIMGISDTGKYTLLQISYTILKDEEVEGYSKCIVTECATLLGYNSIEVERFDSEETTGMGENFASDFS